MIKRFVATLSVVAIGVSGLWAEAHPVARDILKGPVGYLFTKEERKALEKIAAEQEVNKFMDLFWAKRDPDLNTQINEFRLDFDARVAAADKMFSVGSTPGSLTDRGRVLILVGRPSKVSALPAGAAVRGAQGGEQGRSPYEDRGATEIWLYTKDRLPQGIVKAEEVWAVFVETRVGSNEFILDRTDPRNVAIMKVLAEIPERLVKNPKLTEVPRLGLLSGSKAARPEDLAVLEQAEVWPEGALSFLAEGVLAPGFNPLWLYLELPDAVPPAASVVGRVTKADGGEVGTFVKGIAPLSVNGGRGYEFSVPLDPGNYRVRLALLDAGKNVLVLKEFAAEIVPTPGEGTVISPFYWGVDVRQEASARLGDPFNIGGWHVIPRASNQYTSKENLAYFCYIVHPALDENGKAEYRVSLAVYKDDKKLIENLDQPVTLSQVTPDLWMFGNGLPLSVFRKSGDYVLEVRLKDVKADVERVARIPLTITVQ